MQSNIEERSATNTEIANRSGTESRDPITLQTSEWIPPSATRTQEKIPTERTSANT